LTKKILILDAGDAPYPLTVAKSLGSAGYEIYLGFSYGSRIFSAYSKYCKGYLFYPDPLYASTDFVEFFKGLAGKYDFIIPTMEKSQLPISTIKEHLERAGTSVPIPDRETLNVATNKALMLKVASKNGIPTPPTLISTEEPNVGDVVKKIGIPFIMKVAN